MDESRKFRNGDRGGKSTTGDRHPCTQTHSHTLTQALGHLSTSVSRCPLSLSLSPHTCMGAFAPGARWSCARRTGPSRVYCIPPRTPFRALA